MNSRKLTGLFFKTLLIGGLTGLITSFFVDTDGLYATYINPVNINELFGLVLFYTGFGLLSSAVSQTGFFAYLFINRFGLGFFKGMWPTVQLLLVAFVAFDLVYFPYQETKGDVALYWYVLMSVAIVGYGLIIAKIKSSQTNQRAFVPALFLMVVMTAVEWVPALRAEGTDYAWLMIIPLLACNTYQLLVLHKLTRDEHGQPIESNSKKSPSGDTKHSKK